VIRLNLMRNQFGGAPTTTFDPSHLNLEFDSQESFAVRRSRKPLWFALAAVAAVAAGVGTWYVSQKDAVEVPPATTQTASTPATQPPEPAQASPASDSPAVAQATAAPKDTVQAAPVDPALAAAARAESLRVVEKARKDSIALAKASVAEQKAAQAKARKDSIAAAAAHRADSLKLAKQRRDDSLAQAKLRKQDSLAQAKARLEREKAAETQQAVAPERVAPAGIAPAVTAPALAGGVLDFVLGEARGSSGAASGVVPNRFEDLTPTGRVAYQRFAFEQILNKLRQVTPANGVGFSKVRLLSPGILVVDGETQSASILSQLMQGLAAQSLVDTSSSLGANGRFRLTARLPFSSSAAASSALATSYSADILRAIDLASAQGMELGKPSAPQMTSPAPFRRAAWKLSGTGTWDGCTKWIASLGGVGSPVGFTSLELASGPDGRLKIQVSAIAYGK